MSHPSPAAPEAAPPVPTGVGAAEWDLLTDSVRWSPEAYRLLGRDPLLGPLTLDQLPARLPEQDRPALRRLMTDVLVHGRARTGTVRILRPGGAPSTLRCAGRPVLDEDGRITALRLLLRAG
ncbi:PAS domain-containing protein [Kitasatospora sp. NBC_00315]|uniref:PAS domain-containing protein n=1 Tax=Kitasatospora sp. NBC_00315 TaxID=2975963 RepID=UPI0032468D97